jgi:hypothetical protein
MSRPNVRHALSPEKFFLVLNAGEIIKMKRGFNKEEVIQLLGEPNETRKVLSPGSFRLVYAFKEAGMRTNIYEMLFREHMLETVIKTKK